MKQHSKFLTALAAALLVSGASEGQTHVAAKKPVHARHRTVRRRTAAQGTPHTPVVTATERELHELHEQITAQQAQIDSLRAQMVTRDQQAAQAQGTVADAQAQAATASAASVQAAQQSTQAGQDVQQLKTSVGDLQSKDQALTETVVANQAQVQEQINSPTTIHYKGITIQPVAFFALEGVWRQRSVNSDINTPFNTIPLPNSNEGHTSEFNFSGRQSRLGALFTGDAGKYKLSGYFEADFLGVGTTSNNNQSNSYVLRQRQFWGQGATAGGFAVTGGQMWSLVTENARGTDNRTEILPNTVDPQYMVGFNWTRQPGIRVQQRFGDPKTGTFTLAMALEQGQITNFTAASATAGAVPANFFFGGGGTSGGLYNAAASINTSSSAVGALATYANNVAPDVIVKGAFDFPKTHLEFGGIARFLRDTLYPITSAVAAPTTGAVTYTYAANQIKSTAAAGGVFGAIRVMPVKPLEIGIQAMAGPGVGRYGSTQLADATIKPDGELEPIRNYHGLFSLVTHEGKKLDTYAYYGGEYAQRTVYTTSTGALIGYGPRNLNDAGCYALPTISSATGVSSTGGVPGTILPCASPTRYMQEGMIGLTYRLVNSPKYGRLQYQATYSFLQRNLWSGTTATASSAAPTYEPVPAPTGPRAQDNMIHVGMRYYIP